MYVSAMLSGKTRRTSDSTVRGPACSSTRVAVVGAKPKVRKVDVKGGDCLRPWYRREPSDFWSRWMVPSGRKSITGSPCSSWTQDTGMSEAPSSLRTLE